MQSTPRRAKDPLTAATTSQLLPSLRPDGFRRRSPRLVGRLGECCFQCLDLQKAAFGGGDFCVNYASMVLIPPADGFELTNGDRLQASRGVDKWWPAATPEQADDSMREVVLAVRAQAMPFFDRTRSVEGLASQLAKEDWGSQHHLEMARGACLAWMGEAASAHKRLTRAVALYEKDGREWCGQYKQRAVSLLEAIANGTYTDLLVRWREQSVQTLGLKAFE